LLAEKRREEPFLLLRSTLGRSSQGSAEREREKRKRKKIPAAHEGKKNINSYGSWRV